MNLTYNDDSNFDIKIIVGSGRNIKEFKAHSTILRSRSLYFQRALSDRWNNKEHDYYVFKKPNITPFIFEIILDFIYTKNIIFQTDGENSLYLLTASDEFELLDLMGYVQEHLIKNHSSWLFFNLIISLNFVCQNSHIQKLYDLVLNFTCRNPYSLFKSDDFPLLDNIAMECLLKSDELELEEIEIWDYLIEWCIANSKKFFDQNIPNWSDEDIKNWSDNQFIALKETISPFIPLIRYYYIPKSYINEQIKKYRLDSNTFIKTKTFQRGYSRLLSNKNKIIISNVQYFSKTSNSFIFSFTNSSNPLLSRIITRKNDKAVWSDKNHGPCFGTADLCMGSKRWISIRSDYKRKVTNLKNFTVEEYEILAFDNFNQGIDVTLEKIQESIIYYAVKGLNFKLWVNS
ncbi:18526_t:CDS:2 [Gigaspora margarita]|uniref:18526_t:CDS:1 n=1 Tax=Gigaspora margarita TaxID=4874 RepID=A0ABM8VYI9_GIGMA|nr:18526_t:CDS:2 [Gigaspora margarita]